MSYRYETRSYEFEPDETTMTCESCGNSGDQSEQCQCNNIGEVGYVEPCEDCRCTCHDDEGYCDACAEELPDGAIGLCTACEAKS